jgi:hypothetical protein
LFKIASLAQKEIIQTLKQNGLCKDFNIYKYLANFTYHVFRVAKNPHDEQ